MSSRPLDRLAAWWAWAHGTIADPPEVERSNKLLVLIGVGFAAMAFVHLNMDHVRAPLQRGFWRGGAFLGGSMAVVVLWFLWEKRRDALSLLGGVLGTALVAAPTWAKMSDTVALKANPVLWLGLGWVGIAVLYGAGRRAGVRWADFGLSVGDWRWWVPRAIAIAIVIVVGTVGAMLLFPELQQFYPWQRIARTDPAMFREVQIAVFLDFLGWEYMHRGLLLFALARRGDARHAIWTQAFIFFLLHQGKPTVELMLSLPGGVIAGYFAYRARSFMPLWILHAIQLGTTNQVATMLRGGF